MDVLSIYERVNFTHPMDQNSFFSYLTDAIGELVSFYGEKYVFFKPDHTVISSLDDGLNIFPHYESALVDDVLFYATHDASRKTDFTSKAQMAYHTVWKIINHGKRIRKDKW